MLSVNGIYKVFNPGTVNQKIALRNVSIEMEEGDFVTLIGGNGAGNQHCSTVLVYTGLTGELSTLQEQMRRNFLNTSVQQC